MWQTGFGRRMAVASAGWGAAQRPADSWIRRREELALSPAPMAPSSPFHRRTPPTWRNASAFLRQFETRPLTGLQHALAAVAAHRRHGLEAEGLADLAEPPDRPGPGARLACGLSSGRATAVRSRSAKRMGWRDRPSGGSAAGPAIKRRRCIGSAGLPVGIAGAA